VADADQHLDERGLCGILLIFFFFDWGTVFSIADWQVPLMGVSEGLDMIYKTSLCRSHVELIINWFMTSSNELLGTELRQWVGRFDTSWMEVG